MKYIFLLLLIPSLVFAQPRLRQPIPKFERSATTKFVQLDEPIEPRIDAAIQAAATEFNLHPKLIESIIEMESGWRFNAVRYEPWIDQNQEHDLERSQSWGFMQVMGFHANKPPCEFVPTPRDLINTELNIRCGAAILRQAIDNQGGSIKKGLIEYNGGPKAVTYQYGWSKRYQMRVLKELLRLGGPAVVQ